MAAREVAASESAITSTGDGASAVADDVTAAAEFEAGVVASVLPATLVGKELSEELCVAGTAFCTFCTGSATFVEAVAFSFSSGAASLPILATKC